jgi:hypothetical protein
MADVDLTVTVTPPGGGAAASLHDPANGLVVAAIPAGSLTWDHAADDSMDVDGEIRSDSKRQEGVKRIQLRVQASSIAQWVTRLTAVAALLDEEGYTITVGIGGTTIHQWEDCSPADIAAAGASWSTPGFANAKKEQTVIISFRHSPVTAAGLPF